MTLEDLTRAVSGFDGLQHVDRIKLFAWFLHTHKKMDCFMPADISRCYDEVHLSGPKNVSQQIAQLVSKKPPELLKSKNGYRLEKRIRDEFDRKYGQRPITVQVTALCNGPHFLDKYFAFLRWWAALKIEESQCPKRARVTRPA